MNITTPTIKDIAKDRYQPVFDFDTRNGETLWEMWMEGFMKAFQLSPQGWKHYMNGDIDTQIAIRTLLMLDAAANTDLSQDPDNLPKGLKG